MAVDLVRLGSLVGEINPKLRAWMARLSMISFRTLKQPRAAKNHRREMGV